MNLSRTQFAVLMVSAVIAAGPARGAALRLEPIGRVDVDADRQETARLTAGPTGSETVSFPHHFAVGSDGDTLVFRNTSSGKTVGLKYQRSDASVKITPLLWRELTKDDEAADEYAWSSGSFTNNRVRMSGSWEPFRVDTNALDAVTLPVFKFKENGMLRSTGTTNRTLVSVSDLIPFKRTTVDGCCTDGSTDAAGLRSSYTYELPDGRLLSIISTGEADLTESLTVTVDTGTLPVTIVYKDAAGEGFNDPTSGAERRAAMEYAVGIWGETLFGTIPVVVHASIDELDPGVLGQAGPLAWGTSDATDTEFDKIDTVYVSSLANQLLGEDFWPTDGDIQITYSSDYVDDFYFGLDGNVPVDKSYDFVTIVIHEMAHGLGFLDGIYEGGSYITGNPFVYDHFLWYSGSYVVDLPEASRGTAITSDALYWDGENAKEANGGARIEIYAPTTFSYGSSVGHWDTGINFTSFMEPNYFAAIHTIDAQLLGALWDIEWVAGFSYNAWVALQDIPTGQQGLLDDPAGDGIANIWKYAAGLDALTVYSSDDLYTEEVDAENDVFSLIYTVAKNRPEIGIGTAARSQLLFDEWDTNAVSTVKIGETDESETWQATIPLESQGYIRLQAETVE